MISPKKLLLLAVCQLGLSAAISSAQTLTIVSGQGQLVRPNFITKPLIIELKTAAGAPAQGIEIHWQVVAPGLGSVTNSITFTDAIGRTASTFVGANVLSTLSFIQTTVNASVTVNPSINTNFTVTTINQDTASGALNVDITLLSPGLDQFPVSGGAGTTGTVPVRVLVQATRGGTPGPVPGISVEVSEQTGSSNTIRCQGGTVYTDSSGIGQCTLLFGGKLGPGLFTILVGGNTEFPGSVFNDKIFRVDVGPLAAFRITNGNNQSVNGNQSLPAPLVAVAEDASGNPIPNATVVWEVVTSGTASLSNLTNTSDANGRVSARVTAGVSPGTFQIRLRNTAGTIQALYTFTVNLTLTGIVKNAGDNQEVVINTAFPTALSVTVNSTTGPVPGIQVAFAVSSGSATLSSATATTNAQGVATVNATAGPNAGPIVITASVSNLSTQFTLRSRLPGPSLSLNGLVSAAGGQRGGVTPGGLLQINASGLAPGLQGCVTAFQFLGPFSFQVAQVQATFNGTAAPIYSVCNLGQDQEFVVVQVPTDLAVGGATLAVTVGSGSSTLTGLTVTPASPGIFETLMSDGRRRAVALRADGSYVSLQNPARRGEQIRVFLTGMGAAVTADGSRVASNQAASATSPARSPWGVVVGLNNEGVPNTGVPTLSNYLIGVYELTFEVPANVPAGTSIPFAVASVVNDQFVFSQPSLLPVQ
ncbi:MAG: hypothetical protein ACKV22_21210 [Bryobacteraceae bacterium]